MVFGMERIEYRKNSEEELKRLRLGKESNWRQTEKQTSKQREKGVKQRCKRRKMEDFVRQSWVRELSWSGGDIWTQKQANLLKEGE